MEDKKRIICINDLVDGLRKDDIYEVEQELNVYGIIYYTVKDKYGVFNDFLADRFVDTKQVVISCNNNYSGLLTPYYMVEYFKRKRKELFVFAVNGVIDDEYYLINDDKVFSDYNDFTSSYYDVYYSYASTPTLENEFMPKYDLADSISREDEILIQIAKEINNEDYLKVVDIPFNVKYDVVQWECDLGEYVEEKHRRWS